MKKVAFGALISLSLIGFILIISLLYFPNIRHKAYRSLAEAPKIVYLFAMRKDVINRSFDGANVWLNRQLDFSINMFGGQSVFLPGLMDNASYVIEQAKFPSDHMALLPFINRLADTYPKLFMAHLWRARALLTTEPTAAIESIGRALELIPGDERSYRLAINAALRLGDESLARQYCGHYKIARSGNVHPYHYNPFFYGAHLRGLLLEVVNSDGVSYFSKNDGLKFEDKVRFNFPFTSPIDVKEMRLFVSTASGVSIRLDGVELAHSGIVQQITLDNLYIIPLNGFVIEGRRIIATESNGSGLSIIDKNGFFGEADTITVRLSVRREPLALPEVCG